MNVVRYTEDIRPITIFAGLWLIDVIVYSLSNSALFLFMWCLLTIIPKGYIAAWNHHHQHCLTFRQPILNRLLEIIYFFQTGMSGYGWTLHHVLGHHQNYLDQTKDQSAWRNKQGKAMSEFHYTCSVVFTAFYRAFRVGLKQPTILKKFLAMFLLSWTLMALFVIFDPRAGILVFLVPAIVCLFITAWATYDQHANLDTKDPYAASYNIVDPLYNKLTGNLGYHTAHHLRCGLHWSVLPKFHSQIHTRIPSHCYRKAGFPTAFIAKFTNSAKTQTSYKIRPRQTGLGKTTLNLIRSKPK